MNTNNEKITYLADDDETSDKKILINNLLKKDNKYFHKWFNKIFDQINIANEEDHFGYGDWLSSIDISENLVTNLSDMHQQVLDKKKRLSALTTKDVIKDIDNSIYPGQELAGSTPQSYSSSIFSKLTYEDLKKAHTETVVPVSQEDYQKVLKFNNVEVLRQFRNTQNIKPMSQTETKDYFRNKTKIEDHENIQLAFKLAKQQEDAAVADDKLWAKLRLLQ